MEVAAIDALIAAYGEGGVCPTRAQWERLLNQTQRRRIIVLNFFRVRAEADSSLIDGEVLTGFESMLRYSEVSRQKVAGVGGRFLATALFDGVLMGSDEEWSLVAIAEYPDQAALLSLFEDAEYQHAHRFRLAAVESQRVIVANAL
jgi:uncharacterized protein (DUF1330 family)